MSLKILENNIDCWLIKKPYIDKGDMFMKFCKELYSKVALIKAAYNFTDIAYVHLDADDKYYYVDIESKKAGKDERRNNW